MLNYADHTLRHWSPQQTYATGDVLLSQIARGWEISQVNQINTGRARLYHCILHRGGESMSLDVLDGPAVREIAAKLAPFKALLA